MNGHECEHALDLLLRCEVEGIAAADVGPLESHLETCEACRNFQEQIRGAAGALRSLSVVASPVLIDCTRMRVRARAQQLRERHTRMVLMAVSFCLGVLSSTLTAWLWWKSGAWVAQRLGLPSGIVEPGVLLFWLLPAVVIALVMVTLPPATLEGSLVQRYLRDHARGTQ
jgi:hypothetical protein